MGYNVKDYVRIRDEYTKKYQVARNRAETRRIEIHARIPEVRDIDAKLSRTGLDIMDAIQHGRDTEAAIRELEERNNQLIARRGEVLGAYGYAPDYTDVHYDCDLCGDTGFVETTMCECMKKALVKAGFESSGLGNLIGSQSFENFDFKYYAKEKLPIISSSVEELKSFAEGFDSSTYKNFIMMGTTGLGKTHLSTSVAERVIKRGYSVVYVSAVSMIRDFSNSIQRSRDNDVVDISKYYDCDLLIIDDLGTEVTNRLTQSYFYEVINERINGRRCTIINTNLTVAEIKDNYSDRVFSRVLGEYVLLPFEGVDIRKQKSLC